MYQTSDTPAASRWGPGRLHVSLPCPRLRSDFHGRAGIATWHAPALLWPGPCCLSPCVPSEGSGDQDVRAFYPMQSWHILVACPQRAEAEAAKTGGAFLDHQGWGPFPWRKLGSFTLEYVSGPSWPAWAARHTWGCCQSTEVWVSVNGGQASERFQHRIGCGGHSLAPAHRLLPPPQAPRPCRSPSRTCRPRAAVWRNSRLSSRATHSPQ